MYNTENQYEKKKYEIQIINQITDASFLRLLEAVLESGSQLTLLIYIFTQTQESGFIITATGKKTMVSIYVTYVQFKSVLQNNPPPSCAVDTYINLLYSRINYIR